ncbi:outer membrane protein assembly factor BamA [Sedimentisphaera salicampi]|uniref:outer membrane protein assembly factor BamA n=1 Tax=Sedimentisphaera salicampi TaxID=1941349 RepID=UPI000B9B8A85|nr:outer membrane protein assembly factor BamA [Sedimentisphaera salicampi]OXU15951.1 Outer membrane protein Omp85 [Sedimentisphaera salicampi]
MLKRVVALVLFAALACGLVQAEDLRIVELKVKGNATLSKSKILSTVSARPGQTLDEQSLSQDTEKLAELDAVQFAYYNTEPVEGGVKLNFVVVEKMLISEISFYGNDKISDKTLSDLVDFDKGDYLEKITLAAALDSIRNKYTEKGYYFAEVKLGEKELEQGKVIFRIEEGPRIKVTGVRYEGNTVFTEKQLDSVVKFDSRILFLFKRDYNTKKIEQDIEAIEEEYRSAGYINVDCNAEPDLNEKLNKAEVVFYINEGRQCKVLDHSIKGVSFFDKEQIENMLKVKKGMAYDSEAVKKTRENIRDKYLEKGFIEARIRAERDFTDNGDVRLVYDIDEGKRFKIGEVRITGNYQTHDKVVRRELDYEGFKPGRWYDGKEAKGNGKGQLEKDVKQATLAEDVFIKSVDGEKPGTKDAVVNITEGMTGMVMFGAGIDSNNGLVGQVIYEQRNFDIQDWPESLSEFFDGRSFKGAGQRLRISLEPGTEVNRYSIDFTDPYAWERPFSLNLGSSRFWRGRECYDEERTKGYIGLTRRYEDDWYLGIRLRAENVTVSDLDADSPQEIYDVEGDTGLFGTKFSAKKKVTDDKYIPTEGYVFDASFEQVTGDYNFGVVSSSYTNYETLKEDLAGRRTVFSTKIYGAAILGDAPPFEKFYAGGSGSLRGFDYRGVSPRGESTTTPGVYDDPIGSDWIAIGTAEITFPLASDRYNWLLFGDAGMIDEGGPRTSIGTGIEILIPQWFGPVPMRFEIAAPITKEGEDETEFFSFSMGRLF